MADRLELVVPRQLKSPNVWNGRHWRYKHRESQEWEKAVWEAIVVLSGAKSVWTVLSVTSGLSAKQALHERRRVTVTRLVPSARNFIRDDDNLRFATKPLNDALKRLGLIYQDSRKWLEQPMPTQEVSKDGYQTRIVIERVDEALRAIGAVQ